MDIEQEKDIFNIIEDLEKKASTSNSFRLATLSLMKAKTCYARKRRANDEYTDILVGDSQDKYMNRLNYERNLPRTNPKNFGVLHMPTNREHKYSRLNKTSVFSQHINKQFTGLSHNRISQLKPASLKNTDHPDLKHTLRVYDQIRILDVNSKTWDYSEIDKECLFNALKKVNCMVYNFDRSRVVVEGPTTNLADEPENIRRSAILFLQYGGLKILLRVLLMPVVARFLPYKEDDKTHFMRNKCLVFSLLCNLISMQNHYELVDKNCLYLKMGPNIAEYMCNQSSNDEFPILDYAFQCMHDEQTALPACQFIEDLLQAKMDVFNLSSVKDLKSIIMKFDHRQLANFCRICAVTISDLDIYEDKSSLFQQNKQKRSLGFINIRDINQEFLLSIPNLLSRLVKIACSQEYLPREGNSLGELSQWMDWINVTMDENVFEHVTSDDFEDFLGGVSVQTVWNGPITQQIGLHISGTLILRVQVVYVLGLFLVGKHRKKVQRRLAELNMIPGLSNLFDKFIWKCVTNSENNQLRLRGHNEACECSPEVALKIQFLRLVHSFCDHSDYKHLLLTESELVEIQTINDKAGELKVSNLDTVNPKLMCRGSKGLLSKIVEVMKLEPTTSTFRFWLARAVESYLRGSPSYCDQIFLLNRGLLQHIVSNIVNNDIRLKEILQSSFDLIGELIKFNLEAFIAFDKVLDTPVKRKKFYSTVNKNLVDSNMFIRSLILSIEHFRTYYPHAGKIKCSLLVHIGSFNQQILYLQQLIKLINVENLTQENVSCLNTTLVFLMFANRHKMLPKYLTALSRPEFNDLEKSSSTVIVVDAESKRISKVNRPNGKLVSNFRDLLIFWQDHYLHKDKDCSALEKSSRIKFEYWKETVNTLASADSSLFTSASHYF